MLRAALDRLPLFTTLGRPMHRRKALAEMNRHPTDLLQLDVLPPGCGVQAQFSDDESQVRFRGAAPAWGAPRLSPWTGWYDLRTTQLPIHLTWVLLWPEGAVRGGVAVPAPEDFLPGN